MRKIKSEYVQEKEVNMLVQGQKDNNMFLFRLGKLKCTSQQGKNIREQLLIHPIKSFIIQHFLTKFPEKPTPGPQCTQIFNHPITYYKCYDCMKHQDACLCESCFLNGNHQSHRFDVRHKYGYSGNGTCDCGNGDVWDSQGFCRNHKGYVEQIEIGDSQIQRFTLCFQDLFQIYFSLLEQKTLRQQLEIYQSQLFGYLLRINKQSLFYNKLTYVLFSSSLNQNSTILGKMMNKYLDNFKVELYELCIKMIPLPQFRIFIVRNFLKAYNSINSFSASKCCRNLFIQIMGYKYILNKLAIQEDLVLFPQYGWEYSTLQNLNFIRNMQDRPLDFWKCFLRKGAVQKYYSRFKDIFSEIVTYFQGDQEHKKYLGIIIRDLILNQDSQGTSQKIFVDNTFIYALLYYYDFKIEKIDFKTLLKQLQIEEKDGNRFLFKCFQKLSQNLMMTNKSNTSTIQIFFKIAIQMPNQIAQQIFDCIWKFYHDNFTLQKKKINDKQQAESNYQLDNFRIAMKVFYAVNQLSKALINQVQLTKIICTLNKRQTSVNSELTFKKQYYLKCILSEKHQISDGELRSIVISKIGEFQGFSTFIKSISNHNCKKQQYTYKQQKIKDEKINITMDLGQKPTINSIIELSQQQKSFFYFAFSVKFLNLLNKIYKFLTTADFSIINKQGKCKILDLGLQSLVYVNIFCQVKVPELGVLIEQLKNSNSQQQQQKSLHPFYSLLMEQNQMKVSFQKFFKSQNHLKFAKIQSIEKNLVSERKKKMMEVKQKKFEEMKAKMKRFRFNQEELDCKLERKDSTTECCLFCHQGSSQNNYLYCFAIIKKNYFISNLLESQQYQFNIKLCQHFVHKKCFLIKHGQQVYFTCPLCRCIFNCILPRKYTPSNIQQNSQWQGRIETLLLLDRNKQINIYMDNNIEIQKKNLNNSLSTFTTLFSYLVFSNSIKCLFTVNSQQSQRLRTDNFIKKLIFNMYQTSDVQSRNNYKKQLSALRNYISNESSKNNIKTILKQFAFQILLCEMLDLSKDKKQQQQSFKQNKIGQFISSISEVISFQDFTKILNNFQELNSNPQNKQLIVKAFSIQNSIKKPLKSVIKQLTSIQIPQNAEDFLKFRTLNCSKCNLTKIKLWQCLICKDFRFCEQCQNIKIHTQIKHQGSCILLSLVNAEVLYVLSGCVAFKQNLYVNEFNRKWSITEKPKNYVMQNPHLIENLIMNILNNDIPQSLEERYNIIQALNSELI